MVIASLTDLGFAGVVATERPPGVIIHSVGELFLLREGGLESFLLLVGARGATVRRGIAAGKMRVDLSSPLPAGSGVVGSPTGGSLSRFRLASSEIGAGAGCPGDFAFKNLLVMFCFHCLGDALVYLGRDMANGLTEILELF